MPDGNSGVRDQLVLAKDTFRVILVNVVIAKLRLRWEGTRGVNVADVKEMLAARVQVGNRNGCRFRDLPLNAGSGLNRVRRAKIRRDFVDRWCNCGAASLAHLIKFQLW